MDFIAFCTGRWCLVSGSNAISSFPRMLRSVSMTCWPRLRCRAQVLRVEKTEHGYGYGLACRLEDYRVLHGSLSEAPEPAPDTEAG